MLVLQTERLGLRHMTPDDAAFMLGMLNDPAWHRFIGNRGLAKRDFLDDVDIGYAFLPAYGGQGYAFEAAQGVLAHARELGLQRLVATVVPENDASIRLLEKLGLRFERSFQIPAVDRDSRRRRRCNISGNTINEQKLVVCSNQTTKL
jgi:RimJ/RimL family protein N-acetyltransferase